MIDSRLLLILLGLLFSLALQAKGQTARPAEFVDATQIIPDLVVEMRYFGSHNFVGRPIKGYQAPRCLLTRQAAKALAKVQNELKPMNLGLKVYDCYRPQRAVNNFSAWARALNDKLTKTEFYPDVPKTELFKRGYIAAKSSHSRGSTLDLTLIPLPPPVQDKFELNRKQVSCSAPKNKRFNDNSLDMGTGYDCFDALAHTANPRVGAEQRANRLLLKTLMHKHGFKNYDLEWWHFTLKDEPFPDTYFDFPIF